MKKSSIIMAAIAGLAISVIAISCNKDATVNTVNEEVQRKEAPHVHPPQVVQPHFLWRLTWHAPCNMTEGTYLCGFDLSVLTGEEACILMPLLGSLKLYMPKSYLEKTPARELIDSAQNGSVSLHADCRLLSKELVEIVGTDMIPAGQYETYLTTYNGEEMVCIEFNDNM